MAGGRSRGSGLAVGEVRRSCPPVCAEPTSCSRGSPTRSSSRAPSPHRAASTSTVADRGARLPVVEVTLRQEPASILATPAALLRPADFARFDLGAWLSDLLGPPHGGGGGAGGAARRRARPPRGPCLRPHVLGIGDRRACGRRGGRPRGLAAAFVERGACRRAPRRRCPPHPLRDAIGGRGVAGAVSGSTVRRRLRPHPRALRGAQAARSVTAFDGRRHRRRSPAQPSAAVGQ